MKNKQKGFIGKGVADGVAFIMVLLCIASAIVGWGVIEGIIWLFSHISIGWIE